MLQSRTGKFWSDHSCQGLNLRKSQVQEEHLRESVITWEKGVLAQISAMKSNISVGAGDAHPGVQRQLTYETALLPRELSKCRLNHRSARAMGKGNQALTRIQDE